MSVMNLGLTFMSSAAVAVCLAGADAQPPAAAITWRDGATMLLVPAGSFVMGSGKGADGVGFRCAAELLGATADSTAERALRNAEEVLSASLRDPVQLSFMASFAEFADAGSVPFVVHGLPGQSGLVCLGLPLPRGRMQEGAEVGLRGLDGRLLPVQSEPLARWSDGSLRWLLLRFLAAGSGRVQLLLTLIHEAERREPFSEPAPVAPVRSVSLRFAFSPAPGQWTVGTDKGALEARADSSLELRQRDDLHYRIARPGKAEQAGTRAPGWATASWRKGWCRVGVRHFWQNAPKGLDLTAEGLLRRLWAGPEPFAWEAGLAKTHEIVLEMGATAALRCQRTAGGWQPVALHGVGLRSLRVADRSLLSALRPAPWVEQQLTEP